MRLTASKPTSFLCETVMALIPKHALFTHFPLFNSHSDFILYNILLTYIIQCIIQILTVAWFTKINFVISQSHYHFPKWESRRWFSCVFAHLTTKEASDGWKRGSTTWRTHKHLTHQTAICRNPYSSWNWDFVIYRQLGYKHTCQNVVSTHKKNCLSWHLRKHITCSVLVYSGTVKFSLSQIKLRIGRLRQLNVLWATCKANFHLTCTHTAVISEV